MAKKNLNILVAGGYDRDEPQALEKPVDQIIKFCEHLGKEIIDQGHNLLTGCQTDLDKTIAEATNKYLSFQPNSFFKRQTENQIISYVMQGQAPIHNYGIVMESDLPDLDLGGMELKTPEIITHADVIILLGGFYGTFKAANWARINRKPILPFANFGGAAQQVYAEEIKRFNSIYANNINRLEYDQILKTFSNNWELLATQTVSLAEKIVTNPSVFVIMPFKKVAYFQDLYSSIQRVCEGYEHEVKRIDEVNLLERIIPEMTRQLKKCAFVIADITDLKPNVFYELGFAHGFGKEVILCAKAGTELPFDIQDVPVIFCESFVEFEEELQLRVEQIGAWQGRLI